jgi:hypothetical protein
VDTKKSVDWVEEMTADFGLNDLVYTKNKGEEDLEALEASYKVLKDLESSGKYLIDLTYLSLPNYIINKF